MTYYFIGPPGARPRLAVGTQAEAAAQILPGEVFLTAGQMGDYVIAADGQALEPWVPPIEQARVARWMAVKALRDGRIDGGAPTPIGVVDSDLLSRTNITGASVAAQVAKAAGAPFAISWTDKANAVHTLDADGMIMLGLAVMGHVDACHDRARALRTEIEAAVDHAALDAIDITTGWPS